MHYGMRMMTGASIVPAGTSSPLVGDDSWSAMTQLALEHHELHALHEKNVIAIKFLLGSRKRSKVEQRP